MKLEGDALTFEYAGCACKVKLTRLRDEWFADAYVNGRHVKGHRGTNVGGLVVIAVWEASAAAERQANAAARDPTHTPDRSGCP